MPEETPLTKCEELLALAHKGDKLDVDQRRDVVAFLMATQPGVTNADMARLFAISEGMVRKDKDIIRKRMAEEISNEDVGLVIGDILRTFERFKNDLEKGIKKCDAGTKTYLDYQKALLDYQLKIVEALQSLGHYPKNLGTMNTNKFVFKSTVQKDGSVETKAIDPATRHKVIEGEVVRKSTLESDEEARLRDALRDEYSETPRDPSLLLGSGPEDDLEP